MSILAGIVVAMTIYLVKRQIKGNLKASSSSILVSLIAPACPSCAIGLLSVLGFGGFLAVLPFKGLELGFIGLGLLGVSTVYLSNKITTKTSNIAPQGDDKMENNDVLIKKSTLWKGAVVVLIAVLVFFVFKSNFGNGVTGNVVTAGDNEVVEVSTLIQGFEYQPDTITVKKGSTVRLTIDNKDNVNHGLHLMQFGVMRGLEPRSKTTVEFVAKETPTNGQAVPTCSQEHGETLTINVV
jgi:plastocyanin